MLSRRRKNRQGCSHSALCNGRKSVKTRAILYTLREKIKALLDELVKVWQEGEMYIIIMRDKDNNKIKDVCITKAVNRCFLDYQRSDLEYLSQTNCYIGEKKKGRGASKGLGFQSLNFKANLNRISQIVNYKAKWSAYTKEGMNTKCSPSPDDHVALQPGTQIKLWSR